VDLLLQAPLERNGDHAHLVPILEHDLRGECGLALLIHVMDLLDPAVVLPAIHLPIDLKGKVQSGKEGGGIFITRYLFRKAM